MILMAVGLLASIARAQPAPAPALVENSELWGRAGERWQAAGRLTDFSYAGYHRGERPLPKVKPQVSVKQFGAAGDGKTDDTAAFQRALKEAAGKVIGIPPGRYVITDILEITRTGTVLVGAGPGKTVLLCPKPLEKIRPNMGQTTGGRPTSNYSWSGGIIRATGRFDAKTRARATKPALRGGCELAVDRIGQFRPGDDVRLAMRDSENRSLTRHLYAGDPGDFSMLKNVRTEWFARVARVDTNRRIVRFDRALRTDVRLEWQPVLHPAGSSVEEVGIADLSFEFPVRPYKGHFTELGFNAIAFSNVRNGWVRNIEIRNSDSGLFVRGANITISGVTWLADEARAKSNKYAGHHGITLGGTDLLLTDFDVRMRFIHDITMSRGSAGNVVRRGRGDDLSFDHHKYANHANCFTDIDAGVGSNIFRSGGGAALGRHCGAWETWWNIRTDRPVKFPGGWATDRINLVGVKSDDKPITDPAGRWLEPIAPDRLAPRDIYEAQLKRRLKR